MGYVFFFQTNYESDFIFECVKFLKAIFDRLIVQGKELAYDVFKEIASLES